MRNISFFLTTPQFLDGSKDVTRRLGWLNLKAGEHLMAVRKAQGLKKGESPEQLGEIVVKKATREILYTITPEDVRREGFPNLAPHEFVRMFCEHHKGCEPQTVVTRIEFSQIRQSMIDEKRLAEMERGNAEFRGVTCDDVAALIAEVRRLREALDVLTPMAREYAEGGGFHGPEMREFNETMDKIGKPRS